MPIASTILIVDGDLALLSRLDEGLEGEGYDVHFAANALGAFEMLHAHPAICLLVTDVSLPGTGDGQALADYVSQVRPDIAVLFLSEDGDDGASLELPHPLLRKPFDIPQFTAAVQRILADQVT